MARVVDNLRDTWQRVGPVQRLLLVAVLIGCLAAAAYLVTWVQKPELALLYADLAPEDAAKVVDKLRDQSVPYELRAGGTSVYVPIDQRYALRLDLASEGVAVGGRVGYSILDEEKLGTSPFTQRINLKRALEGELARNLAVIEGVQAAHVILVQPKQRLFREADDGASASVVLKLRPGWRLPPRTVASIVHLVAGSVEGLRPDGVVIVDDGGTLLNGASETGVAQGVGTLLDYKTQVEEYFVRKCEDMLQAVLGPGRASVRVNATVETASVNQTVETYDPDKRVVKTEELTSKDVSPAGAADGTGGGKTKEETILNDYLVSRTVEQTVHLPGKIEKLSVAAFVDLSEAAAPEAAAPDTASAAPSPGALTKEDVEEVIRGAAGLTETDELKVVVCKFNRPLPEIPDEADEAGLLADRGFYLDLARHGSLGVLAVVALVVLKVFGGSKRKARAVAEGETPAPLDAGHMRGTLNLLAGGAGLPAGQADQLKSHIAAALQQNPEEVKRLFRTWVEGREGEA